MLKRTPKGAQGYYAWSSGDASGILEVWWYDEETNEHYVAFENRKGKGSDKSCIFAAKGSLEGNTLVAVGQEDDNLSVTIVFDGDKATVTTSDLFKKSGWCSEGVVLDGVYAR